MKNYVNTREGPFNAKPSALISPCVWLHNSPFQTTANPVGGAVTIVIDKELRFNDATEADAGRLLDSVRIVKCRARGCPNPAFNSTKVRKHRDGKCE
jgi:hypothetical protein